MPNINTKQYWDYRFASGDWEAKSGREQTRQFALSQIKHMWLPRSFAGTILDFGCGFGDAFPIYHARFPNAKLIGMDISSAAIEHCTHEYHSFASFIEGDYMQVPKVDVIIASNVFEHLSNDVEIARFLLNKCKTLYIIVPFREQLQPGGEHINSYDTDYFVKLGSCEYTIFPSRGWSQYGRDLLLRVYLKNIIRFLCGEERRPRKLQLMFCFGRNIKS